MPRSRWDFKRPFCEVCGSHNGGSVSVEGWNTCVEHFRVPKPAEPLFDWSTGQRINDESDKSRGSVEREGGDHEK
jgi:hypothetical protein